MADDLSAALAEIRERERAATPGPWTIETDSCDCGDGYGCPHGTFPYAIVTSRPHTERNPGEPPRDYDFRHSEICELPLEDVEFITAARDYVPRLLAALDAALALPAKWESDGNAGQSALEEDRLWVRQACAEEMRAAALAALRGENGD